MYEGRDCRRFYEAGVRDRSRRGLPPPRSLRGGARHLRAARPQPAAADRRGQAGARHLVPRAQRRRELRHRGHPGPPGGPRARQQELPPRARPSWKRRCRRSLRSPTTARCTRNMVALTQLLATAAPSEAGRSALRAAATARLDRVLAARRGGHLHRGPERQAGRRARSLPAPAPALDAQGQAARPEPRGRVRPADQRGLDQRRPVRARGLRERARSAAQPGRRGARARGRQVPAHDRLRDPERRAHRRRRPRAPRRLPGRRHHGHARGLRQLQRGHTRQVDGRGAHQRRRHGRRRQRHRRRRVSSWARCPAAATW